MEKPSHQQPKMVATMLRVVGVLLEGAFSEVPKQKKSKKAAAARCFACMRLCCARRLVWTGMR